MTESLRIGAVIVVYRDKIAAHRLLNCLVQQTIDVNHILIVDNSPEPLELQTHALNGLNDKLEIAIFPENRGISGALIEAQKWADKHKLTWLWFFDQDSQPESAALEKLLHEAEVMKSAQQRVAILTCGIYSQADLLVAEGYDWDRFRFIISRNASKSAAYNCDAVISSGSLINTDAIREIAGPEPKLFIDGVDFDLCMQFRKTDYYIRVVPFAKLLHKLGDPIKVSVPWSRTEKTYYHLSQLRAFYICRNQSYLEFKYTAVKYWPIVSVNRIRHAGFFIIGALLARPRRFRTAFAALQGTFLGFLGPRFWAPLPLNESESPSHKTQK